MQEIVLSIVYSAGIFFDLDDRIRQLSDKEKIVLEQLIESCVNTIGKSEGISGFSLVECGLKCWLLGDLTLEQQAEIVVFMYNSINYFVKRGRISENSKLFDIVAPYSLQRLNALLHERMGDQTRKIRAITHAERIQYSSSYYTSSPDTRIEHFHYHEPNHWYRDAQGILYYDPTVRVNVNAKGADWEERYEREHEGLYGRYN